MRIGKSAFAAATMLAMTWATVWVSVPARADDFASDLAACAKGPIDATKFAFEDGKTAAEFTINHGDCVPSVVGGDPLLYGMSGLIAALQAKGTLPQGTQACVNASIGQASQPVADVIDQALDKTGLGSLLPASGRSMLQDIAHGQSKATLYQVPGVGIIMDKVTCSCAVASTGLDIKKLKERLTSVIDAVEGCGNLGKKLVSGAYSAAKSVVNAGKKAANSVGCALGLGGCDDPGPPFFCVGYNDLRAGNLAPQEIAGIFPASFFPADQIAASVNSCEQALIAAQKAAYLKAQVEEADKVGTANALGFAFRWIKKCSDPACETDITKIADQYNAEVNDPDTIDEYGSFAVAKAQLDKKYGQRAALAIVLSTERHYKALKADLNAPVADRLMAFGCRPFLGRNRQSLCEAQEGYKVCKDYARRNLWDLCTVASKSMRFFADGKGLERVLRQRGCIPGRASTMAPTAPSRERSSRPDPTGTGLLYPMATGALSAQCFSDQARAFCDGLVKGGSSVSCVGLASLTLDRTQIRSPIRNVPLQAMQPERPSEPERPIMPQAVEQSTLCHFTSGPRADETQDYAPKAPINVGSSCQDGRGSSGIVVAMRPARQPEEPTPTPPQRPIVPQAVEKSTLCRFSSGPRAGQTQDYAPMAPINVGSSCQDGRGSNGIVVAR